MPQTLADDSAMSQGQPSVDSGPAFQADSTGLSVHLKRLAKWRQGSIKRPRQRWTLLHEGSRSIKRPRQPWGSLHEAALVFQADSIGCYNVLSTGGVLLSSLMKEEGTKRGTSLQMEPSQSQANRIALPTALSPIAQTVAQTAHENPSLEGFYQALTWRHLANSQEMPRRDETCVIYTPCR
jgi:hypothetical protein